MPPYSVSLVTKRGGSSHIDTLIRQLDELLYASFVVSYVLDANLLNFVVRSVSHVAFSSPKDHHPDRSLKFQFAAWGLVNALAILYHLTLPLTEDPRGVIIDFIGQSYLPSKLELFIMDSVAALLQAFMIVLTYETGHYGREANLDDGNDRGHADIDYTPVNDDERPSDETPNEESSYMLHSEIDRPVVNLRLRQTLHRIMNDKPVSIVESENGTANEDDSATERLRRAQARIRARRREFGQAGSLNPSEQRVDAASDEEREVGLDSNDRSSGI